MPDTIGRPKQSSPWLRYKLGLDPFGGQEPEPTIEPVPEINWADYLLDPTAKIRQILGDLATSQTSPKPSNLLEVARLPRSPEETVMNAAPFGIPNKVIKQLGERFVENVPKVVSDARLAKTLQDFFAKKKSTGYLNRLETSESKQLLEPASGIYHPLARNILRNELYSKDMERFNNPDDISNALELARLGNPGMYIDTQRFIPDVMGTAQHEMRHLGQDLSAGIDKLGSHPGTYSMKWGDRPQEIGAVVDELPQMYKRPAQSSRIPWDRSLAEKWANAYHNVMQNSPKYPDEYVSQIPRKETVEMLNEKLVRGTRGYPKWLIDLVDYGEEGMSNPGMTVVPADMLGTNIRSIFYRPPSQDYSSLLDRFTLKGKNSITDIYGK